MNNTVLEYQITIDTIKKLAKNNGISCENCEHAKYLKSFGLYRCKLTQFLDDKDNFCTMFSKKDIENK